MNWKIGHNDIGIRDGGSSWHIGTKNRRECKHESCVALFKEEAKIIELKKIQQQLIEFAKEAYCFKDKFDTCGDPFCSDARETLNKILGE